MNERQAHGPAIAAAKAGFSTATAYRFADDSSTPDTPAPRERRRPDPLADVWRTEVVAMLEASSSLRPVAIFEELQRRHPEIDPGVRRTLERRIRDWRAVHGPDREVIFRQEHPPPDIIRHAVCLYLRFTLSYRDVEDGRPCCHPSEAPPGQDRIGTPQIHDRIQPFEIVALGRDAEISFRRSSMSKNPAWPPHRPPSSPPILGNHIRAESARFLEVW